jgi:hypothetical protein
MTQDSCLGTLARGGRGGTTNNRLSSCAATIEFLMQIVRESTPYAKQLGDDRLDRMDRQGDRTREVADLIRRQLQHNYPPGKTGKPVEAVLKQTERIQLEGRI